MQKTGTFVATGQSGAISGRRITLNIKGTFVATVQPETWVGGAWVAEGGIIQAPVTLEYEFKNPRPFRLNCTIYTSGTVTYENEYEG